MNFKAWLDVATVVVGFLAGATLVWRVQRMRAVGKVRPLHPPDQRRAGEEADPVSYTHLTLPTN